MNTVLTIGFLTLLFTAIPFITGLLTYRKLRFEFKVLALLFVVIFLVEAYNLYRLYHGQNTIWIYHFYVPIEFTTLMYVFSIWQTNSLIKTLMRLSIPVLIVINVINAILSPGLYVYNYIPMTIALPIYLLVSTYTLLNHYSQSKGNILRNPIFWVCAALNLFSSCSLMHFIVRNIFIGPQLTLFWKIHAITNMAANLLYAIGFIVHYRFGSVAKEPEDRLMFR